MWTNIDHAILETWLRGPRLKIQRAKHHIDEVKTGVAKFFAENPYRVVVEHNTGNHADKWPLSLVIRIREEIPEEFSAIIGDAAHNLRSALDLLTCAMVRANGGNDERVQFPIARNANSLESAIANGNVKRAAPQFVQFVRSLNPYRGNGGNWALHTVHDLDILDKHKLVIAIGSIAQFSRVLTGLRNNSTIATLPGYQWGRLENGTKLIDIPAKTSFKIDDEIGATFSIAFGKGQPADGLDVVPTLVSITDYIEGVINRISVTP